MTALAPHIGYADGTALARRALAAGRTINGLAAEAGLLTAGEWTRSGARTRGAPGGRHHRIRRSMWSPGF